MATVDAERVLAAAAQASHELTQSDFFYRQLAIHMAREATTDFRRRIAPGDLDGAGAVSAFLEHEKDLGRLGRNEIESRGSGLRVHANVHQCPYVGTCKKNQDALGEVPQCMRAITLIEAISAKLPDRPPMTYDLAPGLVDGKSSSCAIKLRPAGYPDEAELPPRAA